MKKEEKPIIKQYYDVKVETWLPATVVYRVLAEDEEEAVKLIKNSSPINVKYKLIGKKDIKLTVYQAGTTLIKLVKQLSSRFR